MIEILKEKFPERLEGSHQGSPIKGRRCRETDEGKVIPQNAMRNSVEKCGTQKGPKKTGRSAQ